MGGIFKAYDVRGIYGTDLDESIARAIGRAFPAILDEADLAHGGPRVVVSRDMRPSSVPLSEALIEGLTSAGLDVVDVGLATTPMNYFAIGHLAAAGGVQVTASHNPAQYNGLKFSKHEARPVSGDHGIPLLERIVASGDLPVAARTGARSTSSTPSTPRSDLITFSRCFMSLISTVMPIVAWVESPVVASRLVMLVLMSATRALRAASVPFLSSTAISRRTV